MAFSVKGSGFGGGGPMRAAGVRAPLFAAPSRSQQLANRSRAPPQGIVAAPLKLTPVGVTVAAASRAGGGGANLGRAASIPLHPATHEAILGEYRGDGSGGAAGSDFGEPYARGGKVPTGRYAVAVLVLVVIFVVLPAALLKSLGVL